MLSFIIWIIYRKKGKSDLPKSENLFSRLDVVYKKLRKFSFFYSSGIAMKGTKLLTRHEDKNLVFLIP